MYLATQSLSGYIDGADVKGRTVLCVVVSQKAFYVFSVCCKNSTVTDFFRRYQCFCSLLLPNHIAATFIFNAENLPTLESHPAKFATFQRMLAFRSANDRCQNFETTTSFSPFYSISLPLYNTSSQPLSHQTTQLL